MAEKIICWVNRHWVRAPEGKNVPVDSTTPQDGRKLQRTGTDRRVVSTTEAGEGIRRPEFRKDIWCLSGKTKTPSGTRKAS